MAGQLSHLLTSPGRSQGLEHALTEIMLYRVTCLRHPARQRQQGLMQLAASGGHLPAVALTKFAGLGNGCNLPSHVFFISGATCSLYKGLMHCVDPRAFSCNPACRSRFTDSCRQQQTDDAKFGRGTRCVLAAQPFTRSACTASMGDYLLYRRHAYLGHVTWVLSRT